MYKDCFKEISWNPKNRNWHNWNFIILVASLSIKTEDKMPMVSLSIDDYKVLSCNNAVSNVSLNK